MSKFQDDLRSRRMRTISHSVRICLHPHYTSPESLIGDHHYDNEAALTADVLQSNMAQARTNSQLAPDDIKGYTPASRETTSRVQSPAPSGSRQSRFASAAPAPSSTFLLPVIETYGLAKGPRLSTPSLSEQSENSHLYPRSVAHSRRSSLGAPLEAGQPGYP